MFKPSFGCCENPKPVMYFLPGFLTLTRDVWVSRFKTARPKNFEMKFFGYFTKNITLKSCCFWLFSLLPEKPHADPKNFLFGMGWTWVAGSTLNFSDAKHNSQKPRNSNATFFLRYPKNIILKFSVKPFWMDGWPKSPFFVIKIVKNSHVTLIVVPQQHNVSSNIIVTIENMKNDVPSAVCKKYPSPTSGTTPLCSL